MIIQTSLGSEYVPPRIGEVAISRRRPGRFCRDLELYQMSGAPPHLQGCNWLQLNIDNRNAFDNPVLRIIFPRSLASCRFMELYHWLWRNSAHRERSKLTWKLAELAGGSGIVRTACRYLVLNGVPCGKALVLPITAALTCYEAGLVAMLETTRLKTTICKNRFTAKIFDDNSTNDSFPLGRQPLSRIPLIVLIVTISLRSLWLFLFSHRDSLVGRLIRGR